MTKPATIDKAADAGSGVFVVLTCVLAFISGSIIIAPDTVYAITSPKQINEAAQLKADLERPAISDESLAKMDQEVFP